MTFRCLSPYNNNGVLCNCGKCLNCRRNYSDAWAFRMKKEIEYFPVKDVWSLFITLTYNDEHLPTNEKGLVTLNHDAYSKYVKRVRSQLKRDFGETVHLSIIGCGEYGAKTGRPHYHLVVHGIPFSWKDSWSELVNALEQKWKFGYSYVKCCNSDVAGYVTKYSLKDLNKGRDDYLALDVEPPFRVFSNGIGMNYFEQNVERIRREGFCRDGKYKVSIPKYFKDRFFKRIDFVRSRSVALERNVDLLKKEGVLDDGYQFDFHRVASLQYFIHRGNVLLNCLKKKKFGFFGAFSEDGSLLDKYVYPYELVIQERIDFVESCICCKLDELRKVKGYEEFLSCRGALNKKSYDLAVQAFYDLISKGYMTKGFL